jgi:hypothetical protein
MVVERDRATSTAKLLATYVMYLLIQTNIYEFFAGPAVVRFFEILLYCSSPLSLCH